MSSTKQISDFVVPRFHNDSGTLITRGLLYEECNGNFDFVCYTTKERDHYVEGIGKLRSLKNEYMSYDDPTEYMFARSMFYNWRHWTMFQNIPYMREHLEAWRTEHSVMLHSKALLHVMEVAKNDTSQSYLSANKYLLDKGFFKEHKTKAGRPSKEAIKKKAESLFNNAQTVQADWERITNGKTGPN